MPVDEAYPLLSLESYGLSKGLGEQNGDMFTRRERIEVFALCFSLILAPED
ncbi:hypothetical protein MHH52_14480 [Paenibacillus sp. FSL K6-0276]|uniref:hypothetical protein n=1 Tax=Paenibacillus sp. FSL K6-0276 TaxID=2921450 RepID=UPI0030EC7BC0